MFTISGYTPKKDIEKFDADIHKYTQLLLENKELIGVTFGHDGHFIELSIINDDRHIDNVTDKYRGIKID
ncbi:hypothetical protein QTG56_24010 (plasmid) [Rossellomorea sp. AcN35-11]|nr:hypothetical protein [Rossellomorea aquimaris]WJV31704.1 hypothetical protein QTG56_24010 [Rossellomorea sp. AcN35-11]